MGLHSRDSCLIWAVTYTEVSCCFPQSTDKCRDGTSLYVVCPYKPFPTQHSISYPFDIWQHLYTKYLSVSLNEFSDLLYLVLYLSLVMMFIYCHYRCDVFLTKLITNRELHINHTQFNKLSVCIRTQQ